MLPVWSAAAAALIGGSVGFVLAVPISIGAGVGFGWLLFLVVVFAALGANLGANAYWTARTVRGARGRKRAQLPRPGPLEICGALLGLVVGAVVGLDESVAAALAFAFFCALSGLILGAATATVLPWAWAKPTAVEPAPSAAVSTLAGAVALTTMWAFTGQDQLPIGPWVGAALGFILFLAAEDLLEEVLERSPTGWSTRRRALALTIEPAAPRVREPVTVHVRVRGDVSGASPAVVLVLRIRRMVMGSKGLKEQTEERAVLTGDPRPVGHDTFTTELCPPPEFPPSSATADLVFEWLVKARLAVPRGRDPAVEAPLIVLAPAATGASETRRGGEPLLELSLDTPTAIGGSTVAGSVGLLHADPRVRRIEVALVGEVAVLGGPGSDDVLAGPMAPDEEGRFVLGVPADASPTAAHDTGSIRWYVRAKGDVSSRPSPWATHELIIHSAPGEREAIEVGFPPSIRVSIPALLLVLVVVVLLGLLRVSADNAEEEHRQQDLPTVPEVTVPELPPPTLPTVPTVPKSPQLPDLDRGP